MCLKKGGRVYSFYVLSFFIFTEVLLASDVSTKMFLSTYPMIKVEAGSYQLTLPVLTSLDPIFIKKAIHIEKAFWIGKYEVSNKEWDLCYREAGCNHPAIRKDSEGLDNPVARVNWFDAYLFSVWISKKTNMRFRLPTEEEWVHAAKEVEDSAKIKATKLPQDITAPAKQTHKRESFGSNSIGISDMQGNVWEWTLTCWHASAELMLEEKKTKELNNPKACTIRIVRGETRTHVSDIIADTYNGGCGTLKPTANLGFRLIREEE